MREILFRGKRTDNGNWIYGYYFYDSFYKKAYITIGNYCMNVDDCHNKSILTVFEVDAKTVGQYTGLTDKNGKKIFEADMLEFIDVDDNEITHYVVEWSDYKWIIVDKKGHADDFDEFVKEAMAVIGNIHDNPELLEV